MKYQIKSIMAIALIGQALFSHNTYAAITDAEEKNGADRPTLTIQSNKHEIEMNLFNNIVPANTRPSYTLKGKDFDGNDATAMVHPKKLKVTIENSGGVKDPLQDGAITSDESTIEYGVPNLRTITQLNYGLVNTSTAEAHVDFTKEDDPVFERPELPTVINYVLSQNRMRTNRNDIVGNALDWPTLTKIFPKGLEPVSIEYYTENEFKQSIRLHGVHVEAAGASKPLPENTEFFRPTAVTYKKGAQLIKVDGNDLKGVDRVEANKVINFFRVFNRWIKNL